MVVTGHFSAYLLTIDKPCNVMGEGYEPVVEISLSVNWLCCDFQSTYLCQSACCQHRATSFYSHMCRPCHRWSVLHMVTWCQQLREWCNHMVDHWVVTVSHYMVSTTTGVVSSHGGSQCLAMLTLWTLYTMCFTTMNDVNMGTSHGVNILWSSVIIWWQCQHCGSLSPCAPFQHSVNHCVWIHALIISQMTSDFPVLKFYRISANSTNHNTAIVHILFVVYTTNWRITSNL